MKKTIKIKEINKEKDRRKDELIAWVIIFISVLIISSYLELNLFYIFIGLLTVFVIIYFKKEISKVFLL